MPDDAQTDPDLFDQLVEDSDEGPEPGQPELSQDPLLLPADFQRAGDVW